MGAIPTNQWENQLRPRPDITQNLMIAAIPDPELVERVKRGDLDAFEALTNPYE